MAYFYRSVIATWYDCREPLNTRAWNIVKTTGQSTNDYQLGLRLATKAAELSPSHYVLNTLGVAQFRNTLYAEALVTFENGLSKAVENKPLPTDTLFIAMTHHKLGNLDKSRSMLSEFRSKHTMPTESLDESDQAFLKEAIDLIEPAQN
ncbi:MAG: tetratricopeptide repeat protein [Pirellula sp.]|jgi:uncharacterized protein HemY|nr:hypothetical protein [Pirellula sp.]